MSVGLESQWENLNYGLVCHPSAATEMQPLSWPGIMRLRMCKSVIFIHSPLQADLKVIARLVLHRLHTAATHKFNTDTVVH